MAARSSDNAAVLDPARTDDWIVAALLVAIGEDVTRPGLLETPARVMRAWKEEWAAGYKQDPVAVLKTFEDGAEACDEMLMVGPIEFYSHCEHHLAPFFGEAFISYVPKGRIVGLSKLARVLDIFAHRLQVQERLTNQIADTIYNALEAEGVGVVLRAKHLCMCSRGVRKTGSMTITSALRGCMKDEPEARAELFALICNLDK